MEVKIEFGVKFPMKLINMCNLTRDIFDMRYSQCPSSNSF